MYQFYFFTLFWLSSMKIRLVDLNGATLNLTDSPGSLKFSAETDTERN